MTAADVIRSITVRPKISAKDLYLPVCEAARTFCAIGRTGALDAVTLDLIQTLGFVINYLQ